MINPFQQKAPAARKFAPKTKPGSKPVASSAPSVDDSTATTSNNKTSEVSAKVTSENGVSAAVAVDVSTSQYNDKDSKHGTSVSSPVPYSPIAAATAAASASASANIGAAKATPATSAEVNVAVKKASNSTETVTAAEDVVPLVTVESTATAIKATITKTEVVADPTVAEIVAVAEQPTRKKFRVSGAQQQQQKKQPPKRSSLLDVMVSSGVGADTPGNSPLPPTPSARSRYQSQGQSLSPAPASAVSSPLPSPQSQPTPSRPRPQSISVLPVELYGENCPSELYTVYLRKQPGGLGLHLKNIEDRPVIIGFAPSFMAVQAESQAKKVKLFDVIVGVNNIDIRASVVASSRNGATCSSSSSTSPGGKVRGKGCKRARSNPSDHKLSSCFDKIVAALRETVSPNNNNINPYASSSANANNISISLSTIDNDIVCITLARPIMAPVPVKSK